MDHLIQLAKSKNHDFEYHGMGTISQDQAIITTPLFWDCECDDRYIHPRTQSSCALCGASIIDAPDARVNEVIKYSVKCNLVSTNLFFRLRIKMWVCEHCRSPLPRGGEIWSYRFRRWYSSSKIDSGLYCDPCADKREMGGDF